MLNDLAAKEIAQTIKSYVSSAMEEVKASYEAKIAELEEQIKNLPAPEKGDKGDSVDIEQVKELVQEVTSLIEIKQPDAPPTADEVAKSMQGEFYKWALDFERKSDEILRKAISEIPLPKDGEDGEDAVQLEDLNIELLDDGRTVKMFFHKGEEIIERSIKIPSVIYKGVFKASEKYEKGDFVSYGGHGWVSSCDSPEGKPGSSLDWNLAVKRGRDGRESVKIEREIDKVKI